VQINTCWHDQQPGMQVVVYKITPICCLSCAEGKKRQDKCQDTCNGRVQTLQAHYLPYGNLPTWKHGTKRATSIINDSPTRPQTQKVTEVTYCNSGNWWLIYTHFVTLRQPVALGTRVLTLM
jgi:hypothetical protein